jgi:hypothetical protein
MNIKRINQFLTGAVVLLLLVLMAGAFTLSFDALTKEAIKMGINPSIAWLFPVIVDTSIIAGSLFVIWATINQERKKVYMGYVVILVTTLLSALLNRYHSPSDNWLSILYYIVPPIMLAVLTYLLERMIETTILKMDTENKTLVQLQRLQGMCKTYEDKVRELTQTIEVEVARRTQLESDYTRFTELATLSRFINPDVFTLAKVRAGLIGLEEAFSMQNTYKHRHHVESLLNRVTIEQVPVSAD